MRGRGREAKESGVSTSDVECTSRARSFWPEGLVTAPRLSSPDICRDSKHLKLCQSRCFSSLMLPAPFNSYLASVRWHGCTLC